MSKNNLYIPLKVVPYIFISISAHAITAASKEFPVTRNLSQEIDIKISWHHE